MGVTGTIGGMMVDHYGKAYSGPPEGTGLGGTTFYGSLVGKAQEAITSDFANRAGRTPFANYAIGSGIAGSVSTPVVRAAVPYPTIMPFVPIPVTAPMPNPLAVMPHLSVGNYAIRNVQVDTTIDDPESLISKILKTDDYDKLFNRDPTIYEIRSKLRDDSNRKNTKFTGNLVGAGLLSSNFANVIPNSIGRSSSKTTKLRFGNTVLGNNPTDELSKRFKP
jgi:hypothetical protein